MATLEDAISLRSMVPGDASDVAALVRQAFAAQSVVTDPLPSALRITADDVASHLRGGGGVIAQAAHDELVGSVLWAGQGDGLYLSRLAVAPNWRRRGIARRLVATVEVVARELNLAHVRLGTRLTLNDNRRLFATCGFVETEQTSRPGYTEPTSATMEKRLAL